MPGYLLERLLIVTATEYNLGFDCIALDQSKLSNYVECTMRCTMYYERINSSQRISKIHGNG